MNVLVVSTISTPMCVYTLPNLYNSGSFSNFPGKSQALRLSPHYGQFPSAISNSCTDNPFPHSRNASRLAIRASSSVGSTEYKEEPATSVKFQKQLTLPGCPGPLSLIGTGYREKTFAIIGVKVYAAGLYINKAGLSELSSEIRNDSSLSSTIFKASMEKSLQIVLVREVDGKTFWDALDEAISPRIKSRLPEDESALSTFRGIFQGRPLKKGTLIFLTWLDPSKMLVCVSSEGLPSSVDATIESRNVTSALFDVFFGENSVSPSLKSSVVGELASLLK